MNLIERLAKEIGAEFRPDHEAPPFLLAYLRILVDRMLDRLANSPDANMSAEPVAVLFEAALRCKLNGSMNLDLAKVGSEVSSLIDLIDCDDGWPACPWLNCLKACGIALQYGISEPNRTRWPAEAGSLVADLLLDLKGRYNAEIRPQKHAWLREVYATAAMECAAA